ncbi:hypothetical protein RvY_08684 [Ramazzottius varieornatus]|uniref:Uncharacterized protein n=1 Tax=Ramazzottius varieornatus TaxID=947166 RepID=A0A1D1VBD1_RAMVA|nr:hypothetical protein RvY_08684 [Ramazzottius varieornatus]
MEGGTFEKCLREVVLKRDELEEEMATALEAASSASDVERLRKQVAKLTQFCAKFQDQTVQQG